MWFLKRNVKKHISEVIRLKSRKDYTQKEKTLFIILLYILHLLTKSAFDKVVIEIWLLNSYHTNIYSYLLLKDNEQAHFNKFTFIDIST